MTPDRSRSVPLIRVHGFPKRPSRRSAYPPVTWQNASMHSPELEERDTAAVLGLVEALTTAQTLDEYADIAMTGLTELIPCIDSSFNEINPGANGIRWRSIPENSRMDEYAPLFAELMYQNPLVG